jgi:hypothetical protein
MTEDRPSCRRQFLAGVPSCDLQLESIERSNAWRANVWQQPGICNNPSGLLSSYATALLRPG